jgi:hypothetical protein
MFLPYEAIIRRQTATMHCTSYVHPSVTPTPNQKIVHIINFSEDEVRRVCSMDGEKRNAYSTLVGKPEGKRPLGRPRRRWVDNIKMDQIEIGWDGVDWIDLAQDTVMNLRIP